MSQDEIKKLLIDIQEYIERCEVAIDSEWGYCKELGKLIEDDEMPALYARVIKAIDDIQIKTP